MTTITAAAGGGAWTTGATWTGGVAPTAADDAVLGAGSGNVTVSAGAVCRSLDCTNYTGTLTHTLGVTLTVGDATAGAGNVAIKLSAAMTYTKGSATSSIVAFASTSATPQTITSAGKSFAAASFTAAGSWILGDDLTLTAAFTHTLGTINTAGFAVTSTAYAGSGAGVRALTLGATTWTLTSAAAISTWNVATATNMTLSAAASTIVFAAVSAVTRTFAGGGLIYGTLTYTVAGSTGQLLITGANTFSTLRFSDASNARTLRFTAGTVTTVVTAFIVAGAAGQLVTIDSTTPSGAATLSMTAGTVTVDYVSLKDSTVTGGAAWYAGTHSVDVSGNTGWTFGVDPGSAANNLNLNPDAGRAFPTPGANGAGTLPPPPINLDPDTGRAFGGSTGSGASSTRNDPPRLAFPPRRETVITEFQAGHGWTLNGVTGTTFVDDTTDFAFGSQSLRLTTGGAGLAHEIRSPVLSAIDLSAKTLSFAIKIDDWAHYSDIQIRISSNGFTDFAYCKPVYTSATQRWAEGGLWQTITISRAQMVTGVSWANGQWQYSGTPGNVNWAVITGIRIRVLDDGLAPITVRTNLVGHFPQPAKPVLSLVFDDGRATHYTVARPYLDKYRLPATAAAIATSIGTSGYMTLAQIKALRQSSLWSVVCHAYENVTGSLAHQNGYDGISAAAGQADVLSIKNWINDNGFGGGNILCLPHGSWSINTPEVSDPNTDVLAMLGRYFDAVRSTYANTLETWPPADPRKLRSSTATNDVTATNMLDVLDQGIAANAWTIMQFHNLITPASGSTDVTPTVFQAFIDGVASRVASGALLVRTMHEVLQNGFV